VAVAVSDAGFVAVGSADGFATVFGQIWTSTDGIEWTRVEPADRFEGIGFLDVAAGPGGFVIVGDQMAEPGRGEEPRIVLFRSADGRTWERVPDVVGAAGGFATSIGGGPDGYIATGFRDPEPGPIVLVSPDGVAWRAVASDELGDASGGLSAPVAIEGGWIAAGGDPAHGLAALASADGITWSATRIEAPGTNGTHVDEILAGPNGRLAIGGGSDGCSAISSCPGFGLAWWSEDGASWGRIADLDQRIPVGALSADARGFVSFSGGGAQWSPDGWRWAPLGDSGEGAGAADLVTRGDRLVAVGDIAADGGDTRAFFHVGGPDIEVSDQGRAARSGAVRPRRLRWRGPCPVDAGGVARPKTSHRGTRRRTRTPVPGR
jgi:hypothetical protein